MVAGGDLQSALDAPSSDRRRHRFSCSSSLSYFVLSYDELRRLPTKIATGAAACGRHIGPTLNLGDSPTLTKEETEEFIARIEQN